MPSVGPARMHRQHSPDSVGGLLDSPDAGPALTSLLAADADRYTWTAAVVGSNNAAGYQLAAGAPVMAVGGFNGTDPAPTLTEFKDFVAGKRIHYFIRARSMIRRASPGTAAAAAARPRTSPHGFRPTMSPIRVDDVESSTT